jgi:UDP-N-acetylmuramoyl-tripeptide--D-alanyl-D-alanine ligase
MHAEVLGSTRLTGLHFSGAATDHRKVTPGRLFFALKGERVDGFDYCALATKAGASALVVPIHKGRPEGCPGIPIFAVADPRLALGDLARTVRNGFQGKVVGITGSNGKTTTKELTATALLVSGPVLYTQGNFNTDIGLPLTILESTGGEAFWVLEMAMRGLGEIAYLAAIARPHVGVITNVAGAHLERLGSLEAVAKAKGELFHGLSPHGRAVFPAGDRLIENQAAHLAPSRTYRFAVPGTRPGPAFVRVLDFLPAGSDGMVVRFDVDRTPVVVRLPFSGEHNVNNAAAALTVAAVLNVPLVAAAKALEKVQLPPHRSHLIHLGDCTVVDDCYNANPASMHAALSALIASAGSSERAYAILGDMLELGTESTAMHLELGRQVATLNLAGLATVGPSALAIADGARKAGMAADRIHHTTTPEDAAKLLATMLKPADFILVKASRGMRLERAVAALEKELSP